MELEEIGSNVVRDYALKWKEERDEAIKILYKIKYSKYMKLNIRGIERFLDKIEKGE